MQLIKAEHGQRQQHEDHGGSNDGRWLLQQKLQVEPGAKYRNQQAGKGIGHRHAQHIAGTQHKATAGTGLLLAGNNAGQNRHHGEHARGERQQQPADKKQADYQAQGAVVHPAVEGVGIVGLQGTEEAAVIVIAAGGISGAGRLSGRGLFCR